VKNAGPDHGALTRERLIEAHLPLVRALARRVARRVEEVDDLVQAGSIGLIAAVDRFDRSRGCELSAYAAASIVGEMRRHLRDVGSPLRVPRSALGRRRQLTGAESAFAARNGRWPTASELADEAGLDVEELERAVAATLASTPASIPWAGGLGLDALAARMGDFREVSVDRLALLDALRRLTVRERRIVLLRYGLDLSQQEIASRVGVSQVHVSRLLRGALASLRKVLGPPPVASGARSTYAAGNGRR
jgi:RNA polymerase sigma-B factor